MKSIKKIILTGAIVAPLFLMSCFGPPHHGFHCSDKSADHILNHIDDHVDDLDLTKDQEAKYKSIREAVRADILKGFEHRREGSNILESGFSGENPDVPAIVAKMKEHLANRPKMMETQLDHFQEFYSILDEKQKKQVVEMIQDKVERFACDER